MSDRESIVYRYEFEFDDGTAKSFEIELDGQSLSLVSATRPGYPAWTDLSFHKCPNCPLSEDEHPRCPIAANLVDFMEFFGEAISYDEVEVRIKTPTSAVLSSARLFSAGSAHCSGF